MDPLPPTTADQAKDSPLQTTRNLGRLIATVFALSLSPFFFGYCLAYLSTVNSNIMIFYFGEKAGSKTVMGVLIGVLVVAAGFGALLAPFIMRVFSRKNFILVINICAILTCGIIQINYIVVLLICRIFQGFCVGTYMAITPIYINQLVPIHIRGQFGAFTQISVIIGVCVAYGLGVIFTVTNVNEGFMWRFMFGFPIITIVTQSLLLIVNFVPESPVSLMEDKREMECRKVLAMFNYPEQMEPALRQVVNSVNEKLGNPQVDEVELDNSKSHSRKTQFVSGIYDQPVIRQQFQVSDAKKSLPWKVIFLGFQLPFMQQLSGTNMIVTEIGSIVQTYDPNMALYAPLIANIVQLVATFLSIPAMSCFGRKNLILFGNLSLGLIDLVLGIMFLINYLQIWDKTVIYVALAFILLFMTSYGVTIGPIVWLYVPEIIPAKLVPPATAMNWLGCAICIIASPYIIQAVGSPFPVFFGFAGITLILFLFNYPTLIETQGLTRTQILAKFA